MDDSELPELTLISCSITKSSRVLTSQGSLTQFKAQSLLNLFSGMGPRFCGPAATALSPLNRWKHAPTSLLIKTRSVFVLRKLTAGCKLRVYCKSSYLTLPDGCFSQHKMYKCLCRMFTLLQSFISQILNSFLHK